VLVRVSTSQPLVGLASQSAKPALQVNPQVPEAAHPPAAFGRSRHRAPSAQQRPRGTRTSSSQPLAELPSQFTKFGEQVPITHAPATQAGVALATEHRVLQVPQAIGSPCRSRHTPSQHVRPPPHPCAALQPGTQTFRFEQIEPAAQ